MSSDDQLRKDLHKRTDERFKQAILDTFDLFEMAGLEERDAAIALTDTLLRHSARVMATATRLMPSDELARFFYLHVAKERGEIEPEELGRFMHESSQRLMRRAR